MTINEAKKLVEQKYKGFKVISGVPFKGKYVFSILSSDGRPPLIGGSPTVDIDTGKLGIISPLNDDMTGFQEAKDKEGVYFSKEGLSMPKPLEVV